MAPKPDSAHAVLRRRVAKVPTDPGVYRWFDAEKNVLYVGKAKNLRNRMKSYVLEGVKRSAWTEIMCRQIADFEVTVVRSELEAFILESNLIKQFRPKYNIMLKDDKGYVYLRISREEYPRIDIVRQMESDDAKYYGPFLAPWSVRQTLDMLDGILKFRACKKSLDLLNSGKSEPGTPCLDQQIGKCNGLCIGTVAKEEYRERIAVIERFFRGNFEAIKKKAEEQMKEAAKEKKFEKAARIRDVLKFIDELEQKQVVSDPSGENADVFGIALSHGKIQAVMLRQRGGKVVDQMAFALKGEAESSADAMAQFLPQYYEDTQDIPDVIIVGEALPEAELLTAWLGQRKGKLVRMVVPERGKKSKLLEMAERNAEEKVQQQFAAWEAEIKTVEGALSELGTLVRLSAPPRRIEGYDISHLGGTATVGSMVVFLNGKPKREHYRSFNMKTVQTGAIDDYKSIKETLRRRLHYLTDDLKTVLAQLKTQDIVIGKAKKEEQKIIEGMRENPSCDIGKDAIVLTEFLVARKGKDIVGFCRIFEYPGKFLCLRSLWTKEESMKTKLRSALARMTLKQLTKGKVYVHAPDESDFDFFAELGFQHIETPPEPLQKKLDDCANENPLAPRGMIMMYQAAKKKPDDSFTDHPDLLLIDGGKGQLSAAKEAIDVLGLTIPVAGLAKREEEIFLPGEPLPLIVPKDSPARFLLQRVRDEAHRFANSKREKRLDLTMTRSKLDEVPGIGDLTRSALLKRFGSADAALEALDEDLLTVLTQSQLADLRKRFPRNVP